MNQKSKILTCILLLLAQPVLAACQAGEDEQDRLQAAEEEGNMTITITSPAFSEGSSIPTKYTCDGNDSSPELKWTGIPAEANSLALIVDDPDAPRGTWVHWIVYNMPASTSGLPENVTEGEPVPGGGTQGNSSWRRPGYGGPCPPSGTHRYFFKLYALDGPLNLPQGATKMAVLRAMEGHILAEGQLMGTYQR